MTQGVLELFFSVGNLRRAAPAPDIFAWSPEQWAKKRKAAKINATDVADFVKSSRIVHRVNFHVLADHEAGQRNRHQRAVQHAKAKPGSFVFRKRPR